MKKIINTVLSLGVIGGLLISAIALQAFASTSTFRVVQTPVVSLYTSESNTAVSMTITPVPTDLNGVALTMASFGSTPVLTVDPGILGAEEIESFTGLVNNGNNTATLTGLTRDLSSQYPYTTLGVGQSHGAGATVVFSNSPQIYSRLAAPENDNVWTGLQTFSITNPPTYNGSPTLSGYDFVDYQTLLNTAISGAATSTENNLGLVQLATSAQAAAGTASSTQGRPLVLKSASATSTCQVAQNSILVSSSTTGKLDANCIATNGNMIWTGTNTFGQGILAQASSTVVGPLTVTATSTVGGALVNNTPEMTLTSATTTTSWPWAMVIASSTGKTTNGSSLLASSTIGFIGFSQSIATVGQPINIQTNGIVGGFTSLTAGSDYYLQDNGTIGVTPGTLQMFVGVAISTTQIAMEQPASLQYVGSVGLAASGSSVAIPPYVRKLVVSVSMGTVSPNPETDMVLSLTGKTTSTVTIYVSTNPYTGICSWSGGSLTCTASGSAATISGHAYFYR